MLEAATEMLHGENLRNPDDAERLTPILEWQEICEHELELLLGIREPDDESEDFWLD